jgi:hypothetical protein
MIALSQDYNHQKKSLKNHLLKRSMSETTYTQLIHTEFLRDTRGPLVLTVEGFGVDWLYN